MAHASLPTDDNIPTKVEVFVSEDDRFRKRYGNLDLDRIRRELSPEAFEIFMDTVGAVEMPRDWYDRGTPIVHGENEVDADR
jgi:hypothetical protein